MDIRGIAHNKVFWGGGVIAIGGVLYFRYRQRSAGQSANAAAVPADASATDGITDPNAVDPATGYTYADEGYSPASGGPTVGSPYGSLSGLTWNPQTGQYEVSGGTPEAGSVPPSNNLAWGQQATAYLIGLGDSPTAVAVAIGKFLSGQGGNLTADQLSIVQSAIGGFGYPPQAVPAPGLAPSTGQTNPGSGVTKPSTPPKTTVPAKTQPKPATPAKIDPNTAAGQAAVRAKSPRVAALYAYYQAHKSAFTQTAYETAVNQFLTGGESHVPTVAAVQANDRAHGAQW